MTGETDRFMREAKDMDKQALTEDSAGPFLRPF